MEDNLLTSKQIKILSKFIYSYLNDYIKANKTAFENFLLN